MRAGRIDPPPLSDADADPDADGGAAVLVGGLAVLDVVDVGVVEDEEVVVAEVVGVI